MIFERTGRTPNTHQGVRGQFSSLARNEPAIDIELRRFLTDGYDLKSIADYGIGPDDAVSHADAAQAIETGTRFVDCMQRLLSGA